MCGGCQSKGGSRGMRGSCLVYMSSAHHCRERESTFLAKGSDPVTLVMLEHARRGILGDPVSCERVRCSRGVQL